MIKNFNDLDIGATFYNSMTNTLCLKVSNSRYWDWTVRHLIKMKPEYRELTHIEIIIKCMSYYEKEY